MNWEDERDTEFLTYFLDPANHDDRSAPDFVSYHYPGDVRGCGVDPRGDSSVAFTNFDCWIERAVLPVEHVRLRTAAETEVLVNEIYSGDLPSDTVLDGGKVNRRTTTYNLASAWYGYAVGRLAELGVRVVGQDQLVGGPSPDNEAVVSCLDWHTGEPNAKYYSIQMLAAALGSGPKTLVAAEGGNTSAAYVLPFRRADDSRRRLMIVNKLAAPISVVIRGGWCTTGSGEVIAAYEVTEPGFRPPQPLRIAAGQANLSAYALATIICDG